MVSKWLMNYILHVKLVLTLIFAKEVVCLMKHFKNIRIKVLKGTCTVNIEDCLETMYVERKHTVCGFSGTPGVAIWYVRLIE